MSKTIKVLIIEPGKVPYTKEIESGLSSLQHEVDGYIQAVYPYEDPVALICNEEAKLEGKPLNRALRDDEGCIYDVVAGTFMITGLEDNEFGSLSDEFIGKYTKLFKIPEVFPIVGNRIVVYPMVATIDSDEEEK